MTDPNGWKRRQPTPADAARRAEYDSPEYRRERARLGREVKAGQAACWRCGGPIAPGSTWHVGHDDHDRRIVRGAEHSSCNLRAAASKGARIANARRQGRPVPPPPRVTCAVHGTNCRAEWHGPSRDW